MATSPETPTLQIVEKTCFDAEPVNFIRNSKKIPKSKEKCLESEPLNFTLKQNSKRNYIETEPSKPQTLNPQA